MAVYRRRLPLPLALLLLMVAVAWPGVGASAAPKMGIAAPVAQASVAAVEPEAAAPSFEPASAPAVAPPARLQIPALRLGAMVEALGVDGSGAMDTPRNIWNVGWYSPGPSPGASGDAVIDGHVGLPGHPLVFSELARLGIGAEVIVVLADGTRNRFLSPAFESCRRTPRRAISSPPPVRRASRPSPALAATTPAVGRTATA